jgi:phosphate acyltransferase
MGDRVTVSDAVVIALDAMGGDQAPDMVVEGAALARERTPAVRFLMFGDEERLVPLLAEHPDLAAVTELHHTTERIESGDKPSTALKVGRNSSMRLAINAVWDGAASSIVSAGNTGALMAMSTVILRTMAGIKRPAIAAIWPTLKGESVVLDVGATIGVDAEQLCPAAAHSGDDPVVLAVVDAERLSGRIGTVRPIR